jgi:hypothetical protein
MGQTETRSEYRWRARQRALHLLTITADKDYKPLGNVSEVLK